MIGAEVHGADALNKMLAELLPRETRNTLRRTITALAAELRDDVKASAPVDTGTLRGAITSRRERGERDEVAAALWITNGSGARKDAWYWHFVEFGTMAQAASPFIVPAVERLRARMPRELGDELMRQIQKQFAKRSGGR